MKMSTDDDGFHLYEVYCDGVRVDSCFFADEEAGQAVKYKRDSYGNLLLTENRRLKWEIARGKIEIRRRKA